MSVPPPPPRPDQGSFFGAPLPPPPPAQSIGQFGYAPPVYGAPAATFGAPQVVRQPVAASGRTPELVVVACTLLAVFAAVGLYVAAAVSSISSAFGAFAGSLDSSASTGGPHLGTYGVVWGLCGVADIGLLVFLRRGDSVARIAASLVCGGWTLYWLRDLIKVVQSTSGASAAGLGSVIGVFELLLLGLAVLSALPAAVLWLPASNAHFA
jgi:hypothetical protein